MSHCAWIGLSRKHDQGVQWLVRRTGDPRDTAVDAIDWIEQLPFGEIRTCVQRVLENMMIYRAILAGAKHLPEILEIEISRTE